MQTYAETEPQRGQGERLRALVIDTDELFLESIGEILSKDLDVVGLRDPWDAASLVERQKFDGIFLDLNLPGLDGLTLVKRVRTSLSNRATPITVITAQKGAMFDVFAAGAHFFLTKPLDRSKLRTLLNTTYGSRRQQKHNLPGSAAIEVTGRAESGAFSGTISQISPQGLVFHSECEFHPGELIRMAFRLPPSPVLLQAIASITRTDHQHNTGCQFKKLDPDTQDALERFVASAEAATSSAA